MDKSKAKRKIIEDNMQEDLIAKGFHKLDSKLMTGRPPKIQWGMLYKGFNFTEKIKYLEKLASSMNYAAHLIQGERNELGKLCELKEKQIVSLKGALDQNNEMIQGEVMKMNEERQSFNGAYKELNGKLKICQSSQT